MVLTMKVKVTAMKKLEQKVSIQVRIYLLLSFRQVIIFFPDISHLAKMAPATSRQR